MVFDSLSCHQSQTTGGESLTKNALSGEMKRDQYSLRSGLVKEYSSDRYYRQNFQLQRWQAEHQQHEAVEKALADVSKFGYDPEDYVRFLVKEPFREPVRVEYQSLLPERLLAAERRYRHPIMVRWGIMVAAILSVAFFPYTPTILLALALLAIVGFSQYSTIRERLRVIDKIDRETRLEIEAKTRAQEEAIERQRQIHEEAETERIEFYVRLLNGDLSAVVMTIDEYLPRLALPFPLDVDADLLGNVVQLKVWLPAKTIIPQERTSLTESGKIQYDKKESIEINKQYAELCAATLMRVGSVLFSIIPSMAKACIQGMSREGARNECLMTFKMDRAQLEKVAHSSTALVSLQALSAVYVCDEFLKLLPVEPLIPEEWAGVEPRQIRNLQIKIYQRIVPGIRNKLVDNH